MPIQTVHSLDDPLLAPYRNLKDKELARAGGRYIAEGENVVRRLLASTLPVESVLIAKRKLRVLEPLLQKDLAVFVADDELIEKVIGFEFHSGVLACGIRMPSLPLHEVIPRTEKPATIVVCQEIANTENMGSLIRIAAAFGADAMILGERCCDPFFRQSIRVSMGAIFSLPLVRSPNLLTELDTLHDPWRIERLAAVVSAEAQPLQRFERPARLAVVFGNEAQGLDAQTIEHCDRRITIPMRQGIDSLNVAVAAAVFLYHLTGTGS